jgi:transposase-like protein
MARPKKVLTCPHCGSAGLYYEAGLVTGYKYHCKDCDYVGAFVIEKEIPDGKNRGQG